MSLSVSKFQQSSTKPDNFFIKEPSSSTTPNISEVLASFITCPYISIRQLLVSFIHIFPIQQPLEDPDSLLSKEYKQDSSLKHLDQILFLHIHEYKQEKRKHQHLINSLEYFSKQQADIRKVKQECESEQRGLTSIEHSQLVKNLQTHFVRLLTLKGKYQTSITRFQSLYHYSQYLMSAFHEIIKHTGCRNIYPDKLFQQYLDDLRQSLTGILQNIEVMQIQKLKIRHKIKFNQFIQADVAHLKKNRVKQVQQIYYLLYKLSPSIKQSMKETYSIGKGIKEEYKRFLEIYGECEQLQDVKTNRELYQKLIKDQKGHLTTHLKKNHELMVKYSPTKQYSEAIEYIKSKSYIYKMFEKSIEEIEHAIKLLNNDYDPLLNQLCEGKNRSATDQLKRQINYFMNASDEGYNVIILNFLTKLQNLQKD